VPKTILITGATDGIGLLAAELLALEGHRVLLHGRSESKLAAAAQRVASPAGTYLADLSRLAEVEALARHVMADHASTDVVINNAGVLKASSPVTEAGLDIRFVVNTLAPALLTQRLLPVLPPQGRVLNLSSAAQAPVDLEALCGHRHLDADMEAYAQSKLALTMWSHAFAARLAPGQVTVAINPGSLLATKMVKEGFGIDGKNLRIGADIVVRAALAAEFAEASGQYYDNDAGNFGTPHADALDMAKCREVSSAIQTLLEAYIPAAGA
jgi:NAD(P)-dependent dehydrogenase (short-subunit alcohol dehydrogenase family)